MGYALGIGRGYQFRRRILSTEGSKYINAATSNGYSDGSASCADNTFNSLSEVA